MKAHLIDIVKKRLASITANLLILEGEAEKIHSNSSHYETCCLKIIMLSTQKLLLESILMEHLEVSKLYSKLSYEKPK